VLFRDEKKLKLPDFGMYFHTDCPDPIEFTCREEPNFIHDLVFLSSYIHDARFEIKALQLQEKTLHISLKRDRWERHKGLRTIESISNVLTIESVLSVRWEYKGKLLRKGSLSPNEEFGIRHVYVGESYWDDTNKSEIVLSGHGKYPYKLRIVVHEFFTIHLKDCNARISNKK
jgi:hypothetical protein